MEGGREEGMVDHPNPSLQEGPKGKIKKAKIGHGENRRRGKKGSDDESYLTLASEDNVNVDWTPIDAYGEIPRQFIGVKDGYQQHLNRFADLVVPTSEVARGKKSSDSWRMQAEALLTYGKRHGDCNVPFFFETVLPNGQKCQLGYWLSTQRKYRKQNKLLPEYFTFFQTLVDRGLLEWSSRNKGGACHGPHTDRYATEIATMDDEERWDLMYHALVKYGEENGDCNVPHHIGFCFDPNGIMPRELPKTLKLPKNQVLRLGFWLGTQRKYKKIGKIKPEYEARLQKLVDDGKLKWEMRTTGKSDTEKMDALSNERLSEANESPTSPIVY